MFCCCLNYGIIVALLTIIYFKLQCGTPKRPPIFNVYQTPTCFYWFKVAFMFSVISLRKILSAKIKKQLTPEELDRRQPLSSHEKAIDAVYFNSANQNGDYLITGTAIRKQGLVDAFLILKVADSNLGVLVTPKVPDTSLYKLEENDDYSVEGLTITPVIPMKKWKLTYSGKMKKEKNNNELYDVQINLDWTSDLPYFNFDTDLDPLLTAKYLALEPWSGEFFKNLENAHQSHYEQFGTFSGTVTINEKTYNIKLDSNRDHSFGQKRYWEVFHRYALHYISSENGDRFAILKICAPTICSDINLGYVYVAKDKKCYPLQSNDMELYQHGEGGTPPDDYAFSFTANNQHYTMQVNVTDSPVFYMSKEWSSKVLERLCTTTINGKKGWGITEWVYRNVSGRSVANSNVTKE